ncbi:MAG: ABC transporter ATP-binding protein [Candidatus Dadabacteria bacterium]
MAALLKIEDLSVDFLAEKDVLNAVKHINLEVNKGQIVALVGESGSGKSVTSLSILQLLPSPPAQYSSGKIWFTENEKSVDLLTFNANSLQEIRGKKISMIFQEPMTSLNPVMSCGRQVMEALLVHYNIAREEAKRRAIEWFRKVQLPDPEDMFNRYPHQLSGGQKQRVMISMAMCCEPSLLICDEPTTALDVTVQKEILNLIKELQQQQNMGVIFITHDLGVVAEIADRVAIMYQGEIVEQGDAEKIFSAPHHPYTKALIACRPALHPREERLPIVSDYMSGKTETKDEKLLRAVTPKGKIFVKVENLVVQFPSKKNFLGKTLGNFTAVNNVSFEIYKNETLGLVGESGCGKTTIGRTLLRLVEPTSGKILFKNEDITSLGNKDLKLLRKDIQLVFQDPYSSLNPRLTIGTAIAEPMAIAGIESNSKARRKRVGELLEMVNLSAGMINRYPHEFSGGQRQRIVIARALGLHPDFLVCDESVSALDVSVQAQVLNLLNDLKNRLGLTMLFISHDLSVVRYMCDRIMVMEKGKIVETGSSEDIYMNPKTEYTRKLLSAIPAI